MQPRTRFQKLVAGFQKKLKPATPEQIQWGFENCFTPIGHYTKHQAGCLECGHVWKQDPTLINTLSPRPCPSCGKPLKLASSRKRKYEECSYYAIPMVSSGFQVVRTFYLTRSCMLGRKPVTTCTEVMQHWISPEGKTALYSQLVNGMSIYYDQWIKSSDLELRDHTGPGAERRSRLIPAAIYPKGHILPEIKRNGFTGKYFDIPPALFFHWLLSDSRFETLLKSNQKALLRDYAALGTRSVDKYWNSIKICIRNGYRIKNAVTWVDYLDLLSGFNKDLLSSHYVCPINLKESHDALVRKRRAIQQRELANEQRKSAALHQEQYEKDKGSFFGIAFSNGRISVKVLETIAEFIAEGDAHKHCVFTNKYFEKPESLLLSARIGDKPLETIELSLTTLQILQARGAGNRPTEYHSEIIELVNKNIHKVSARLGIQKNANNANK